MREIKFRAWDKNQRFMAYQGKPDLETIKSFMFHFGDKTLMQYTGLNDKNGTEIYEGDLLGGGFNHKYKVCFGFYDNGELPEDLQSGYGFYLQKLFNYRKSDFRDVESIEKGIIERLEVIGNIYETPELIDYDGR